MKIFFHGLMNAYYVTNCLEFIRVLFRSRQPLLDSAPRRDLFLHILERVRRRYRLIVLGYVVMPEHRSEERRVGKECTLRSAMQALKLGFVCCLYGCVDNVIPRPSKGGES